MASQRQSKPSKTNSDHFYDIQVAEIKFEHRRDPLGIGTDRPRFSWIIKTDRKNWLQSAYQIELRDSNGNVLVTSPQMQSGDSVLVPWPFDPLQSRQEVALQVRVWGIDGSLSEWSKPETLETGLLDVNDWEAKFIGVGWEEDPSMPQPSPLFRREFALRTGLKKARLYASALGLYELEINGAKVGKQVFSPGWTSYRHRLHYQTYDITALLDEGKNAIGAILGEGWYRGRIGLDGGRRAIWGDKLGLFVQLELHYEDGQIEKILTDQGWRCKKGPILMSSIYDGETYDARLEQPGWSQLNFDDSNWSPVTFVDYDLAKLRAPEGPPIRRIESIFPVEILTSPSGKTILDFGQNLVGWLRIRVHGQAGQTITLRHAEVLENGELCTWPLRDADATDTYILKGNEIETWEPKFTFHGFRYAEISGWSGEMQREDIQAVVLHSDMARTGWFESSNKILNQFHRNVVWSMRGNFLGVPTDCPQRAERLGWTGDIQVFSPTACFLFDVSGLLSSWLKDLTCDQQDRGGVVPVVVPNMIEKFGAMAGWGDAATVVPWVHYQRFGDKRILENQYDSMRAWVEVLADLAGENYLWDHGFQFGDWLDPSAPQDNPAAAKTDPYLLATAYFAHSTDILAKTASLLGKTQDAAHYNELAQHIRSAFTREYVTPAGRLMSDAATAYCLALSFGLLSTVKQRVNAVKQLARIVRENDYRISTGFIGTPLVCDTLCEHGYCEDAYKLLMQTTMPSWLYPVTKNATTIWERWDAIRPDGTIPKSGMLSFNHYALGAVADWLHRIIAGLAPGEPGYHKIRFHPMPGPGLTHARAAHKTPYGMAEAGWSIEKDRIRYHLTVPANTTADVQLREAHFEVIQVGSGEHAWTYPLNS